MSQSAIARVKEEGYEYAKTYWLESQAKQGATDLRKQGFYVRLVKFKQIGGTAYQLYTRDKSLGSRTDEIIAKLKAGEYVGELPLERLYKVAKRLGADISRAKCVGGYGSQSEALVEAIMFKVAETVSEVETEQVSQETQGE